MSTNKLKITVPNNNIAERLYILQIIIKDYLGIDYLVEFSGTAQNYHLKYENKTLIIHDAFFNKHKEAKSYLHIKNIPDNVNWLEYQNNKIPIIYGNNQLTITAVKVECALDIFASSFFMLSRWEEYVIDKKDAEGRCPEDEMFVVKHKIYHIAVVNEYCCLLKYLLQQINFNIPYNNFKFSVLPTHDVDFLFRYKSVFSLFRNLLSDLLRRKSISCFLDTIKNYTRFKQGKAKDPFDTFDFYMDLSDKYGYKSAFYFIPSVNGEKEATYSILDKRLKPIIDNINTRKHEIGIHPSKNTFHNKQAFSTEYNRLKSLYDNIKGGRQHFLLYDLPKSMLVWEEQGLTYDCGLGFYNRIGFRCGTCYPYRFFDIENREMLRLIQKPMQVMDIAALRYKKEKAEILKAIKKIIDTILKHQGLFVVLWHNSFFDPHERKKMLDIYKEVLKYCNSKVENRK